MNYKLSSTQVSFYKENGYLIVENFLDEEELEHWRKTVFSAVENRAGQKMPGKEAKVGEDDGINKDADYFGKVFDQLLNLWQTDKGVKELMLDRRIGEMVSALSNADGVRIWHDQALFKRPFANPTAWHLDTPFWSFSDRQALSIWVALDDSTLENGCLYFIPGSFKHTKFENVGIGKNMNGIFEFYPELAQINSVAAPLKAGSCSFHNGLTIHGAGPNMTNGFRRAMTCAYMPDGNVFNGQANILPKAYLDTLAIGDLLNNEEQNPLIYHKAW
ncbi:ectoine hydroxylase-related dioxygenase (phytanoyl-CoA dioxygenase family) [Pedobacter sp. AK017]|uniref:phytanoyl-CoA dioxygenase family protein n=1 Tax=Pedobacter sp. AK017 TaxID=2723073 RepID=UPI00160EF541|nr:phytanoyl-CoA dioxygenase family protein [Pedobacter sp. AK017]MBB5436689.1 ectoine hydroxylase-related dioxygenase (phytanoyl-CoA dioxygenase family) [Pedobacter sp. AK017]